ncbi:ABC transporter permease [Georgenia sp. SUBG003]|uniref:ABC transporter permease n=1 Tax=Georgenia sp. SUBG003 TaxID=1497974 RepID=UPI000693506E
MTATVPAAPDVARGDRPGMRGLPALVGSEFRLFLRDPGTVFFSLVFPAVLVVGVGLALPGMRDPFTDAGPAWDGLTPIAAFLPVVLATAIAAPALSTMPTFVAGYRERGVLRRLSTTPMRPQGVLLAQVAVNVAAFVVAAALGVAAGALAFEIVAPRQVGLLLLALVLGAASTFGVGLVIAALAPKGSTAGGIGMLVYFPMLFFAGLWTPGPVMPDAVAATGRFTPLGAAGQAMEEAWFGTGVPAFQLVVMAVWVLVLYPVAAKVFRWS